MSKTWKIAIGVIVAIVVIGGAALGVGGLITLGNRVHAPGRAPAAHWQESGPVAQLEVELMDDDGDGVPDRGVIELPSGPASRFGRDVRFGRGFGPGHGVPFGRGFGPFLIVGRLAHLVVFAGLVVVGLLFYRRWKAAHPPVPPSPAPAPSQEEE
jgi:hypothetical protein